MKTRYWKYGSGSIAAAFLAIGVMMSWGNPIAPAQEAQEETEIEAIEKLFREALFAEEGEQNLEQAERGYREVLERYGELRKMAATATFRLGECYRKRARIDRSQGLDERAARQFEQVVLEFPEMAALVKLSRENLAAMGMPVPETGPVTSNAPEAKEIVRLEKLFETSPDKVNELPTPLFEAAGANQLEVAGYLIKKGIDLNRGGKDGKTPLRNAAFTGNLEMVKLLIEAGADLNQGPAPPLHSAVRMDREKVVVALIEAGADLNRADSSGDTPVLVALAKVEPLLDSLPNERRLRYLDLLAEAGADLMAASPKSGKTPIHAAIESVGLAGVDMLLKHGADPNADPGSDGITPLHLAVLESDVETLKRLIEAGADVNRISPRHMTPLASAIWSAKMLELLIEAGADVNGRSSPDVWTPLHFAAHQLGASEREDVEKILRLLLDAGADTLAWASRRGGERTPMRISPVNRGKPQNTPLDALLEATRLQRPWEQLRVEMFYEAALASLPRETLEDSVWMVMPHRTSRRRVVLPSGSNEEPEEIPSRELRIPGFSPEISRFTPIDRPPRLSELLVEGFEDSRANFRELPPDLKKLRILRRTPNEKGGLSFDIEEIDYVAIAEGADVTGDPQLQWGDIVWIDYDPEGDANKWTAFDAPVKSFIERACRRTVTLRLGEREVPLSVRLRSRDGMVDRVAGNYIVPHFEPGAGAGSWHGISAWFLYRFDADLSQARLIRNSGDRHEELAIANPSKLIGYRFDPKGPYVPSLGIQDGDVLELEQNDPADPAAFEERLNAIWISRPDAGYLGQRLNRESFAPRLTAGAPLGSVVADHFSAKTRVLPHPDFNRLRLHIPTGAGKPDRVEEVALSESAREEIPWGTIVEIPIQPGKSPETWTGLSAEDRDLLFDASKIKVALVPEGLEPREIVAGFEFPEFERTPSGILVVPGSPFKSPPGAPVPAGKTSSSEPFARSVLRVLTKSAGKEPKWDFNRVEIRGANGEKVGPIGDKDPHLLEGDVIELPRAL